MFKKVFQKLQSPFLNKDIDRQTDGQTDRQLWLLSIVNFDGKIFLPKLLMKVKKNSDSK